MTWQSIYKDDFNKDEKGEIRPIILKECEISESSFYKYLSGKKTKTVILTKIESIIKKFRHGSN